MALPRRSELRAQRNAGIGGAELLANTVAEREAAIAAKDAAISAGVDAIEAAEAAVAAVLAASDLATAQAAVGGDLASDLEAAREGMTAA